MNDGEQWLTIERTFNAPIDLVWAIWTEPKLFRHWYGPKGASVPATEMDLVVGGTRSLTMEMNTAQHSFSMHFTGTYKTIEAPYHLAYTESMCDETGAVISPQSMGMPADFPDTTEVIIDLSEASGKTLMKLVHVGVKEAMVGAEGWHQAFDKIDKVLSSAD